MKHTRLLPFAFLVLPALLAGQDGRPAPSRQPGNSLPTEDAGMVYVDEFYIDVFEFPNREGALPEVDVSWQEARDLCAARGKRLCTEREWRQAAAGSQDYPYGYGPTFESDRCNTPYLDEGMWKRDRGTLPCGTFRDCTSDYGVHDMIGNVWEWTEDRYSPQANWRVVRGGSWFHNVNFARVDGRYGQYLTPDYRLDLIGFRCCRTASDMIK